MIYQEYLTSIGNTDGVYTLRMSYDGEIKWEIKYINTIADMAQCLDTHLRDYLDINPIYPDESAISLVAFRTNIQFRSTLEFIQISQAQFNIVTVVVVSE